MQLRHKQPELLGKYCVRHAREHCQHSSSCLPSGKTRTRLSVRHVNGWLRKVHQDTHSERQEGLDTLLASAMAAKTAVHGLPPRVAQDAVAATHCAYSHSSIQRNTCTGMLGDQSS